MGTLDGRTYKERKMGKLNIKKWKYKGKCQWWEY
jgi:hypothetical protein